MTLRLVRTLDQAAAKDPAPVASPSQPVTAAAWSSAPNPSSDPGGALVYCHGILREFRPYGNGHACTHCGVRLDWLVTG